MKVLSKSDEWRRGDGWQIDRFELEKRILASDDPHRALHQPDDGERSHLQWQKRRKKVGCVRGRVRVKNPPPWKMGLNIAKALDWWSAGEAIKTCPHDLAGSMASGFTARTGKTTNNRK